jgi:hypothetical protein
MIRVCDSSPLKQLSDMRCDAYRSASILLVSDFALKRDEFWLCRV